MNLGNRLKLLRREIGLSQEAFGAQGFISTPGWIKIENNQRQASEKLIVRVVSWLVENKYLRAGMASPLKEELFTLKYLGSRSPFVRAMATAHAGSLPNGEQLLAPDPAGKPLRGRPRKHVPSGLALVAEDTETYKVQPRKKVSARK